VYSYFALFRDDGVWEQIMTTLRERCRVQIGREATPSAGIIDSQSVRFWHSWYRHVTLSMMAYAWLASIRLLEREKNAPQLMSLQS
jgi:transposase